LSCLASTSAKLCSLAGLDETGAVVLRRRMKRASVLPFTAQLETCTVAMEACCGAHHLGRQLVAQGHVVRLMSPVYVQPHVKAQKNDERDAEAIAEAATRPTMRYVEIKSEAQLEVQSLHRVRGRLVAERTALINQLRALMLERGIAVPLASSSGICRRYWRTSATVLDRGFDSSLRTYVRSGGASTSGSKGMTMNSPNRCAMRTLPSD
jgi:transposase